MQKIVRILNEIPFLNVRDASEGLPTYVGHGSYSSDCNVLLDVTETIKFMEFHLEVMAKFEDATGITLKASQQVYFTSTGYGNCWRLGFFTEGESWGQTFDKVLSARRELEKILKFYVIRHEVEWNDKEY